MSKFAEDDCVRVTNPNRPQFDSTGKVLSYIGLGVYAVRMLNSASHGFHENELTLADVEREAAL